MSGRYPVEALLRPPVEVWSAVSAGTGAVLVAMVPGAFLMPPAIAHLSAVLLGALAVRRALEARRVLRYQRTLRRLPRYTLKAHRLPLSRTRLFLGRGFRWTQQLTQRLHDAQQPTMRRYLEAPAWRRWLEARARVWERRRYTAAHGIAAVGSPLQSAAPALGTRRTAATAYGRAASRRHARPARRAAGTHAGDRDHTRRQDPVRGVIGRTGHPARGGGVGGGGVGRGGGGGG